MYRISSDSIYEQTIKKSIFICYLKRITNVEEANEYLKLIKKKHYDATHNCYCYILNNGNTIKRSDDGEPTGTAGIAICEVLQKNELTDVICIVTRYFGGIKLGAGGLIRAYSSSASENIKLITKEEIINYQNLKLIVNYSNLDIVLTIMKDYKLLNKSYLDDVTLEYLIEENKINELKILLIEKTNGKINII